MTHRHMQDCFRKYPEIYGEEIADEEAAEKEAEAAAAGSPAAGGDVPDATPKDPEPAASAVVKSKKPETPVKVEDNSSTVAPSAEKKVHDATSANAKVVSNDTPKPAPSASPVAAPAHGDSQELRDGLVDGQRAIPKRSFDATSANSEGSK